MSTRDKLIGQESALQAGEFFDEQKFNQLFLDPYPTLKKHVESLSEDDKKILLRIVLFLLEAGKKGEKGAQAIAGFLGIKDYRLANDRIESKGGFHAKMVLGAGDPPRGKRSIIQRYHEKLHVPFGGGMYRFIRSERGRSLSDYELGLEYGFLDSGHSVVFMNTYKAIAEEQRQSEIEFEIIMMPETGAKFFDLLSKEVARRGLALKEGDNSAQLQILKPIAQDIIRGICAATNHVDYGIAWSRNMSRE